jgi:hypothetical protein
MLPQRDTRYDAEHLGTWFLYDHDTFLREWALKEIEHTESWQKEDGGYSWPAVPVWARERLEHHYKL